LQHEAADGSIHTIGYMHLYSFSEKASSQMMKTIQEFEAQGVDGKHFATMCEELGLGMET